MASSQVDSEEPVPAGPDVDGRDWTERFDAWLETVWERAHGAALARGAEADRADDEAAQAVEESMAQQVARYVDVVDKGVRPDIAAANDYRRDFAERLRLQWGDALDRYLGVVEVADWTTHQTLMRSRDDTTRRLDPLLTVMAALRGQTLRQAREIHALLSVGFPFGALAASRTMYETAVRAVVLSEHARLPAHADLIERYVEHAKIGWLKHARVYARDAEELGHPPLADGFVEGLESDVAALKKAYGPAYAGTYGWADGLPGITSTNAFTQIETLAQTSHRRGYYMWASHLVHADSRALHLSAVERGGKQATVSDMSNRELADPAEQALWSLGVMVEATVHAPVEVSSADVLTVRALVDLIGRANQAFVDAEESVEKAETDLQTELAAEGKRMTPWGMEDLPVPAADDPEPDNAV